MELATELALLVGEARAADAAKARRRERHLRATAAADASLVGVLMDLADSATVLAFGTTEGLVIEGRLMIVAVDAVGIEGRDGLTTYLPLRALTTVEPGTPAATEPSGNRPASGRTRFAVLLAELATRREHVTIRLGNAEIVGDLHAAGVDIISVRTAGDPPRTRYLAMDQVSGVSFFASG
jgi:hypothetical protein